MTMVMNGLAQNSAYSIGNIISKGGGYMKLMYGRFNFIDAWNFCTPDTNLSKKMLFPMIGWTAQKNLCTKDYHQEIIGSIH